MLTVLVMPNYSENPILTVNDEEYKMLIEVCEEFEKQKNDKISHDGYGTPTEIVIRNHLLGKKLNLSKNHRVRIQGSKIDIDLLLLKNDVDPNQEIYVPENVKMVIEVKNNGVPGKIMENGKQEDPNKVLRFKFNELEAIAKVKNFAVIVLSETLLPPKSPYKWRFKEEMIGKKNCKVFTLVARQLYPLGGLYVKSNIESMLQNGKIKKTGEFQRLISYLQNL